MPDPALEFAVDLDTIRDRLRTLAYFNSVTTIVDATVAAESLDVLPPAAFVSVARETAGENKVIGGFRQWVDVTISILFAVPAERRDGNVDDVVEETRKAVIRILMAWTPGRADSPLAYDRYQLRATGDGLVWGEVLMRTRYALTAV